MKRILSRAIYAWCVSDCWMSPETWMSKKTRDVLLQHDAALRAEIKRLRAAPEHKNPSINRAARRTNTKEMIQCHKPRSIKSTT